VDWVKKCLHLEGMSLDGDLVAGGYAPVAVLKEGLKNEPAHVSLSQV
jgi:hypothetical protein